MAEYLAELYRKDTSCYASLVDAMSRLSNPARLAEPHVRPLVGKPYKGLFELKVRTGQKGIAARVPLVLKQRDVVLLFGETKKSDKPTQQFLDRAVRYRKMIDNKEAQYGTIDFKAITPQ